MKHDPVIGGGFVLILRSLSISGSQKLNQPIFDGMSESFCDTAEKCLRVKMLLDSTLVGFVFLRRFGLLG